MEHDNTTATLAFAQGLAYAWGRNDQARAMVGNLADPPVDAQAFAEAWADACASNKSRPDISGAFARFESGGKITDGDPS